MKKINIKILLLAIVLLASCGKKVGEKNGIIDIVRGNIIAFTNDHKPYDVEVCTTMLPVMGDTVLKHFYVIYYYQNEHDTLRYHAAHIGTAEVFDKCDYKWENDSTVAFKLYNEATKKEAK